jgi:type VI secretion system protein ImpA
LDVENLVSPIAEEAPCGADLEYEPEFGELERASKGKAAQVMGDEEIDAEPPDWTVVYDLAQELLGRSLDLRIAVLLARAALNKHGPEGLAAGLDVFGRLIEQYWDSVHPQLDAEDDYDPMLRLNSLLPLVDPDGMIADLLQLELVDSKAVGKFNLHDWRVANGELSPAADQQNVADAALINAAFMDADVDEIEANSDQIVRSIELVNAFEQAILEQVGGAVAPNFSALTDELRQIQAIYAERLNARGVGVEVPDAVAGDGSAVPAGAGISGDVQSREDAIRMIDKICQFYERAEPASPVPLLLKRARRLVPMNFMEIMQDLAPDGVPQAESIGGVQADSGGEY